VSATEGVTLLPEPNAPRDPFAGGPPGPPAPRRPRLLAHVGRWGRARRWLPGDARRVLDIGCASGYGTAAINAGGSASLAAIGIERDPEHLAVARKRYPWIAVLEGDATDLPVKSSVADAVTMLDLVEHIDRPDRAIAEAHRVLRPNGVLIVSVPHRGLLYRLDALNLYEGLRSRRPHWPPLAPATTSGGHEHRHFTVADLEELLRPWFTVERVSRTGFGAQEFVLLAMLGLRTRQKASLLARSLALLHFVVYIADDLLPLGRFGYHLMVRARPLAESLQA
jgi:SAM-dependent methyltransferase